MDQEGHTCLNSKREIFHLRKYKAYGLASAVIAAFSWQVVAAHADEVTATQLDLGTGILVKQARSEEHFSLRFQRKPSTTTSAGETTPVTSADSSRVQRLLLLKPL